MLRGISRVKFHKKSGSPTRFFIVLFLPTEVITLKSHSRSPNFNPPIKIKIVVLKPGTRKNFPPRF